MNPSRDVDRLRSSAPNRFQTAVSDSSRAPALGIKPSTETVIE
jgi:hypothetical protein